MKEKGHKTTLQGFLTSYSTSDTLKNEYKACDKGALLTNFLNAKKAKESVPMRKSNFAISNGISAKMKHVMASVYFYNITFLTNFLPRLPYPFFHLHHHHWVKGYGFCPHRPLLCGSLLA